MHGESAQSPVMRGDPLKGGGRYRSSPEGAPQPAVRVPQLLAAGSGVIAVTVV